METIEYSYRLFGKGLLAPWQAAAVAGAAAALALWALRANLRKVRSRRLARGLFAVRLAVVLLAGWLLYQPSLYVRRTITRPASLVVLVDDSSSMAVADAPVSATDRLDRVELAAGEPLEGRARAAREMEGLLGRIAAELAPLADRADKAAATLDDGLPSAPDAAQVPADARAAAERASEQTAALLDQCRREAAGRPDQPAPDLGPLSSLPAAMLRVAASAGDPALLRPAVSEAVGALRAARPAAEALAASADEAFLKAGGQPLADRAADASRLSRIALVQRVFAGPSGRMLAARHRLRVETLSGAPAAAVADVRALAPSTDFGAPLRALAGASARDTLSAVVLFSDGRQTSRAGLDPLLDVFARRGVPVWTVCPAPAAAAPDIALEGYALPRLARKGRAVPVELHVRTPRRAGVSVRAAAMEGDTVLAETTFVTDGSGTCRLTLLPRIEAAGDRLLTLTVSSEGFGDSFPENNTATAVVRVLDSRPAALLIADYPTWDLTYLLRAIEESPLKADVIFTPSPDKAPPRGSGGGAVPETPEQWGRYALIVLAGVPFKGFGEADARAIAQAVRSSGAALIVFDGPGPGWARALALPPSVTPLPPRAEIPGELRLPPVHADCPVLALSPVAEDNLFRWGRLSPPRAPSAVAHGALALLSDTRDTPVMTYGALGRGQYLIVGIRDLYRLREFDGWRDAGTLYRNIVELAAQSAVENPLPAVRLFPRAPTAGRPCILLSSEAPPPAVRWTQGARTGEAAVQAGRGAATVVFPEPGTFAVAWPGSGPSASGRSGSAGDAAHEVTVLRPVTAEQLDLSPDEAMLEHIAAATGGRFCRLADFASRAEAIAPKRHVETHVREYTLWHSYLFMSALVAACATEYLLRRKAGLVL